MLVWGACKAPQESRYGGGFPKLGVPFWGGPYNKDSSILVSMLGSSILGNCQVFLGTFLGSSGALGPLFSVFDKAYMVILTT